MGVINFLINFELKFKQYKIPFFFLFLFWLSGFIFFFITESGATIGQLVLYSLTIRSPINPSDGANLYGLLWPILLEVIVFGFIMGELLEKYNPVITCRIIAKHKRNHAVIIGYQHLSEWIVDYCVEHKRKFTILEDDEELVEDLISSGLPVVVGDPTEESNLIDAGIKRANEIFINVDDARIAIICTEKIRKVNSDCSIFVRAFGDHIQEYLKANPLNAYSFSTSKWAMEMIQNWIKGKTGNAVVIGFDNLTHRIAYHLSLNEKREIFLFDEKHEGIEFVVNPNLHIINDHICFLSDLKKHVNLEDVTQVFICWKEDSEFDESLYLTSKIDLRYPHIELFVRIFDPELAGLVEKYSAITFSTSRNAFKMLQREVGQDSVIAPNIDD